jgi:NAD(P)-dependent dehydrogenase (short-subunit alcohol dehydrogenase family)
MLLEGKNIIVTGGASGIGRACCVGAAKEGANVAVADINRAGAEETAGMVRQVGRKAIVVEMDTSKAADAERMTRETLDAFGHIDGIVCGALKLSPSKLEDLTEEAWDALIDVGLKGYFLCAQSVGRHMLTRGTGSIVLIASVAAVQAYPLAGAYSVAKAGATMLAKLIGVEWGNRGIRGNAVIAGQCRTPMTEAMFQDPEIAKGRAAVVPMNRVALPHEIADACLFLLSERASYINASAVTVDGGQVESKMMHTPGRNWGGKKIEYSG